MARSRLVCPDPTCRWWVSSVLSDEQCAELLADHEREAHRPRPTLVPLTLCRACHCLPCLCARAATTLETHPDGRVTVTIGPATPDQVLAWARGYVEGAS